MYYYKLYIILIFHIIAVFSFYNTKVHANDLFEMHDRLNPNKMRLVQWDRDKSVKKTTWLIGSDGYRRLINDESTMNCLKNNAGLKEPDVVSAETLDKYFLLLNSSVVCSERSMGLKSQLEIGTYIEHVNGAKLMLTYDGLFATSSRRQNRWTPAGKGNRLILQEDQNLVLYNRNEVVWTSNTKNSGANRLSIEDTGAFVLLNEDNEIVWSSEMHFNIYRGKIIYWQGEPAQKKTLWLVGADGRKRRINDEKTHECLRSVGFNVIYPVNGDIFDHFSEVNDVWAICGADRIGPNGSIEKGSYLKAGDYILTLRNDDLILTKNKEKIWSTGKGGAQLILQLDGNLVIYHEKQHSIWATITDGKQPGWLILGKDGLLRLYDGNNKRVWSADINIQPEKYHGKIIEWDEDSAQKKSLWLVGADGRRRLIHDTETYKCLKEAGFEDSIPVDSEVLEKLPVLDNVWATCGTDRIGPGGSIEKGSYLKADDYELTLTDNDLILTKKEVKIWSIGKGAAQLILQLDGNLVVYDSNRKPTWTTSTQGKKPGWLILGKDGLLRLYDGNNHEIWSKYSRNTNIF